MSNPQMDQRFDNLAVQVHEWTESALALDEGHFPTELVSDLDDLNDELKDFLEEEDSGYGKKDVTELFITPEMAEVVHRFSKVRRHIERAWGPQLIELIDEEGEGFVSDDEDE